MTSYIPTLLTKDPKWNFSIIFPSFFPIHFVYTILELIKNLTVYM